jgi:hypothetical protein
VALTRSKTQEVLQSEHEGDWIIAEEPDAFDVGWTERSVYGSTGRSEIFSDSGEYFDAAEAD